MDKTERLLDALNNPDKYSSSTIEEMLKDPEVKEIFVLLDKTKSSLQQIPTPDIEDEWIRFRNKNLNERRSASLRIPAFFSGKIAASFIIAIISITAVAAIVGISVSSQNTNDYTFPEKELTESVNIFVSSEDSINGPSDSPIESFETVVFDNEPLEFIMNQIGNFYGYKIKFRNEDAKSIRLYYRWDQASTIREIVESLNNFEQIHIAIEGETIKID